ncbi:glycogen debranching protein GlgX [uncultured Xylophilus sp.]|uniref:glycogen debranching protein GlgX n=1 Tax=uncultured Xylophilus sp. TaxID=296832 RepID=UPI0025E11FD1|nr:glycogen debranching protein GlgX [uncultured Xylophilus sp.]
MSGASLHPVEPAATPAADGVSLYSRAKRGTATRLGAHFDGKGTNFALHSVPAERIELCLYAEDGSTEVARVEMADRTGDVWHVYLRGCRPGTRYGYRVHGPYKPEEGLRFNASKLLIDPYAQALDRPLLGAPDQYAYVLDAEEQDLAFDDQHDNGATLPKGLVVDPAFDWEGDQPPAVPWGETVFYEVHVKGFTQQHPDIPEHLRGTYAGMASDAAIAHLKRIGVTAVELLPVQAFIDDERLVNAGLANYWGYNTVAFFAPEPRYGAGEAGPLGTVAEFKGMVKALHAAGIEVILDVVYNHTGEGNHLGPTLSFKGIDHGAYYRLSPEDRRFCVDYTGTGNTLDSSSPVVLRLIMDSLRYWVEEMHVDGFRFDLASTLARGANDFDPRSAFFSVIQQDPVLAKVKLIAEPWDVGPTGYQVGGFPAPWAEWNGKYRDAVRDFWRGEDGALPEFAARIAGSADIYGASRRAPLASVNIVTVHDGFTLHDLVSYNEKHNDANHENNRDGESHNRSWNCGAEGETDDEGIRTLRERQKRNLLTTLFVSQGTPLLLGGDEISRTQGGNNNGYCQDSAISWYDWSEERRGDPLAAYVRRLIAFRKAQPVLHRTRFFGGQHDDEGRRDIGWYNVWGQEMTQEEWTNPEVRLMAALLDGGRTAEVGEDGSEVTGDSVLLLINASHEDATFTVPDYVAAPGGWTPRIDSATPEGQPQAAAREEGSEAVADITPWHAGEQHRLPAHSMVVLTQPLPQ